MKSRIKYFLSKTFKIFTNTAKYTEKVNDPYHIDKKYILDHLPNNPIILDCGSHDGRDSLEFLSLNRNCKIHCIEPVQDIYQRLVHNTKRHSQIITYNCALSNQNGKEIIFVSSGDSDGSSSLLSPKEHLIDHPGVVFDNREVITTYTLDEWVNKNKIGVIDLLWLDMQGMEFEVLNASIETLKTVKVIHTEVSLKETYIGVRTYHEFKKFLFENGFILKKEAIPKGTDMGNALFVKG